MYHPSYAVVLLTYIVTEQLHMHINDSGNYSRVYQNWVNSLIHCQFRSDIWSNFHYVGEFTFRKLSTLIFSSIFSNPLVVVSCLFRVGRRQAVDLASLYVAILIFFFFFPSFYFSTDSWHVISDCYTMKSVL